MLEATMHGHPPPSLAPHPNALLPRMMFGALLGFALTACSDMISPPPPSAVNQTASRDELNEDPSDDPPDDHHEDDIVRLTRVYGQDVKVGNGFARTFVLIDERHATPREIGIALDESALQGLPAPQVGPGPDSYEFLLPLPEHNNTPYSLVELDWNPKGHEPPGIYDKPHFDFHFYTITLAQRDMIVPSDPAFAKKADKLPTKDFVPTTRKSDGTVVAPYVVPLPPGAAPHTIAVPQMGVHWIDPLSPEFKPGGEFTRTFVYGSWDGQFTFAEPMIRRDYLINMIKGTSMRPGLGDVTIPVPTALRYTPAGYYPGAYRITYDAVRAEYRVALSELAWRY